MVFITLLSLPTNSSVDADHKVMCQKRDRTLNRCDPGALWSRRECSCFFLTNIYRSCHSFFLSISKTKTIRCIVLSNELFGTHAFQGLFKLNSVSRVLRQWMSLRPQRIPDPSCAMDVPLRYTSAIVYVALCTRCVEGHVSTMVGEDVIHHASLEILRTRGGYHERGLDDRS